MEWSDHSISCPLDLNAKALSGRHVCMPITLTHISTFVHRKSQASYQTKTLQFHFLTITVNTPAWQTKEIQYNTFFWQCIDLETWIACCCPLPPDHISLSQVIFRCKFWLFSSPSCFAPGKWPILHISLCIYWIIKTTKCLVLVLKIIASLLLQTL